MRYPKNVIFLSVVPLLMVSQTVAAQQLLRDGQSVELVGIVQHPGPDEFVLKGTDGSYVVEVDDFDSYPEGSDLHEGDEVTVRGVVDADLFHSVKIEASEVLVPHRYLTVKASAVDEEDVRFFSPTKRRQVRDFGTVVEIRGRSIVFDTGERIVVVDTSKLGFNPLDNKGFLRVDVGDRLKIRGHDKYDLQERRQVIATSIVKVQRIPPHVSAASRPRS